MHAEETSGDIISKYVLILSKYLLIIGAISSIYVTKVFSGSSFSIMNFRADAFFIPSVILFIIGIGIVSIKDKSIFLLSGREKVILFLVVLFFFFCLLASYISLLRYGLLFETQGIKDTFRLIVYFLLFCTAYFFLKKDTSFYVKLSRALYIPTLFLVPLLFFPAQVGTLARSLEWKFLLADGFEKRFTGLTGNPTDFSHFAIVSVAFLYPLLLYHCFFTRNVGVILRFFIGFVGVCGLLFWAQSKGYIIALAAVLIIQTYLMVKISKKYFSFKLAAVSSIVLLSGVLSLIFLNTAARQSLMARLSDFYINDRLMIWNYFVDLFFKNIFGLGFNYWEEFGFRNLWYWTILGPHSAILDILILGGIGAFLCSFFITVLHIFHIKNVINFSTDSLRTTYFIGAVGALFAVWFAGLFEGAPLLLSVQWLLFALLLAPARDTLDTSSDKND